MPTPEILSAVRHRIAEKHVEFQKIVQEKALRKLMGRLDGEQLTRVPKGFNADHPAAGLLRYKQFFFYVELPAELALSRTVQTEIRKRFEVMTPLIDFLNAPLTEARRKNSPSIPGFLWRD